MHATSSKLTKLCAMTNHFLTSLFPFCRTCLMNKDYQESRCQDVIRQLYVCCSKLGDGQRSTACPKPEIVAKKLREFGMAQTSQGWK